MAQKVSVSLEDDVDGGPADETVRFGFDGTKCEIDLSTKTARAFGTQLAPFVEHARKAGLARRPGRQQARQRCGESPDVDERPRHGGARQTEPFRRPEVGCLRSCRSGTRHADGR